MSPAVLLSLVALAAAPARGGERLAVIAVHDPPASDSDLSELTHQLRAACTDRVAGVLGAPEMRARLAGRTGGATLAELDRAFGGALAVYQNGEFESAARTLKAIVADLEELPESEATWNQWTRAMMRLSHVHFTMGQLDESEAVQLAVLRVDSGHQLDPVLYAPGYRAHFDELRARVRAMPKRRLTVTARGRAGTIYVGGRDIGTTPATVILPPGTFRVGGAAGALRPPSFTVDLASEDRSVVLDFALAEAVRPNAGPGLALAPGDRAGAIIRAGAWLGVDRLLVTSRGSEGEASFLVGAVYDVRRGALLREGSVRMAAGGVPGGGLGALAAFLLTGQASREVNERGRAPAPRPPPPPAPPPPPVAAAAVPVAAASVAKVQPAPPAGPPAATPVAPASPPPAQASAAPASAAPASQAPVIAAPASPPAASVRAPAGVPPAAAAAAVATAAASAPAAPAAKPPAPDLRAAPPPPPDQLAEAVTPPPAAVVAPPSRWMRPVAIGAGVLALGLTGVAIQQGRSAQQAYAQADAMVLPGGVLKPGADPAVHAALVEDGSTASRNAWVAGSVAVCSAATAGLLAWLSR